MILSYEHGLLYENFSLAYEHKKFRTFYAKLGISSFELELMSWIGSNDGKNDF